MRAFEVVSPPKAKQGLSSTVRSVIRKDILRHAPTGLEVHCTRSGGLTLLHHFYINLCHGITSFIMQDPRHPYKGQEVSCVLGTADAAFLPSSILKPTSKSTNV